MNGAAKFLWQSHIRSERMIPAQVEQLFVLMLAHQREIHCNRE
jgi:hypothetical protein